MDDTSLGLSDAEGQVVFIHLCASFITSSIYEAYVHYAINTDNNIANPPLSTGQTLVYKHNSSASNARIPYSRRYNK